MIKGQYQPIQNQARLYWYWSTVCSVYQIINDSRSTSSERSIMSAEALRFLASSHGAGSTPTLPPFLATSGTSFRVPEPGSGNNHHGSTPQQHMAPVPPTGPLLDPFRSLPGGMPPMGFFPHGLAPPVRVWSSNLVLSLTCKLYNVTGHAPWSERRRFIGRHGSWPTNATAVLLWPLLSRPLRLPWSVYFFVLCCNIHLDLNHSSGSAVHWT